MIERLEVQGKPAYVIWLNDDMSAGERHAPMAKVIWDDGGMAIMRKAPEPVVDRGFDPNEERDPHGRWTALAGSKGDPALVSTAPITAGGRGEAGAAALAASKGRYTRIDMALLDRDPVAKEKMVALFRNAQDFPMIRQSEWTGNTDQDARLIIERMKSNLHAMYGDIKPSEIKAWRGWYEGAHNLISDRMAQYKQYNISRPAMTAVYAAQSPNTEWDINVHYGDQLLDTYFNHATHRFDAAMRAAGQDQLRRADEALTKEEAGGKDKSKARAEPPRSEASVP